MKIIELLESQSTMQRLVTQKMPAKVAYALARNIKQMNEELKTFDETRVKLLEENWKMDPETSQYKVPPEDQKRWQDMYANLIESEVKIDPYMIKLSLLDSVELTPGEMLAISWMVTDSDPTV